MEEELFDRNLLFLITQKKIVYATNQPHMLHYFTKTAFLRTHKIHNNKRQMFSAVFLIHRHFAKNKEEAKN